MAGQSVKIIVTGGAGFIGSAFIRQVIAGGEHAVVNLDKLTYAANLDSLGDAAASPNYRFAKIDICDGNAVAALLTAEQPDAVIHLAAESHVDRSIDAPAAFIETNIVGTYRLLEAVTQYWRGLDSARAVVFRFHHVSTDEVYGSLGPDVAAFSENSPYRPNSPYAASKAASDHLVRSYVSTYRMPALITNCSNNYGPCQHPEKLIPLMIIHALEGKKLPIYGDGSNVRDWLHVSDHCEALISVIERGRIGETYNVGGGNERNNREVVGLICDTIDRAFAADNGLAARFPCCPAASGASCRSLISYVTDRPGHDRRYAIDATKLKTEIGNRCSVGFETGLPQTVRWYLDREDWWRDVISGAYRTWIDKNYGFRIAV
jgi:dTDP-glucose 4,6-dehydratase